MQRVVLIVFNHFKHSSTSASSGNFNSSHWGFHGHRGQPMLCDYSLSELGYADRRMSGSFCCYYLCCSHSSERNENMKSTVQKKVHLTYGTLVILQIKNWIQMLVVGGLVSLQVMLCPSFPHCDWDYWDCVTCGLPFVILCLEITVRQGQQRDAQLSSLPSASHLSLMIKTPNSYFCLRRKHRHMSPYWRLPVGNQGTVKTSKTQQQGAIQVTVEIMKW